MTKAVLQGVAIACLGSLLSLLVHMYRYGGFPEVRPFSPLSDLEKELNLKIEIGLQEAMQLYNEGKALFLDARGAQDFEKGHIKNAINIPYQELDRYKDSLETLPRDVLLIVYCDGVACTLSKDLALALIMIGYDNVRVLVNGWTRWLNARGPIER